MRPSTKNGLKYGQRGHNEVLRDYRREEGKHQKMKGFRFGNTSGTHIEEGVGIKLPYRRTVRTFHVVGIDLKLRPGLDKGRRSEDYIVVLLRGIGPVGPGSHDDGAVETHIRTARSYAVDKLG